MPDRPSERAIAGLLDFVALDVETANPFRGSICQIGVAVVRQGQVVSRRETLVRPPRPHDWFDPDHTAVHGIGAWDLRDAPRFEDYWPYFRRGLEGRHVVAHNASFDTGALRDATAFCGFEWPILDYACSLVIARQLLDLPSYTLDVVADALGVELQRHHDALCDAVACAQITLALARRTGATSLDALLADANATWGEVRSRSHRACRAQRPLALATPDSSPETLPLF